MTIWQDFYSLISVLNLFLAAAVIFIERRNVAVTWAWLMVLLFLPGVGFILYLMFGQNVSRWKIYRLKEEYRARLERRIEGQRAKFSEDRIHYHDPDMADYRDMIYMNLTSAHAIFTQDNRVETFTDGQDKFDALIRDIRRARDHVHLMYYIVRNDGTGGRLLDALTEKAREGVEVRFLYDHIGCTKLPRGFFDPLEAAGGRTAAFFPSRIPFLNFKLNYRNHRKLAIIDGQIGYIGGFNVGDEYVGLNPRFGYWRDTHLRMEGSAVHFMQARFMLDWNISAPEELDEDGRFFPTPPPHDGTGVQIVTSGPDNELEQIKNGYIKMIHAAKEYVYIQTPYFIPDDSLLTALKMAALSGVDVRIMIPARPDHKWVYWASYSYLSEVLAVGVKCFLYRRGFLHAKTVVMDDKVASVGTANIDIRSFKLNFEVNAFVYDTAFAGEQRKIYERDMASCTELTYALYRSRPIGTKLKESVARLLSPIF